MGIKDCKCTCGGKFFAFQCSYGYENEDIEKDTLVVNGKIKCIECGKTYGEKVKEWINSEGSATEGDKRLDSDNRE